MKIGQEIIIKENATLGTVLSENIIEVKIGDKAIVTKLGIKYLTGEASGKIKIDNKEDVVTYDVDNISKRIARSIERDFGCDLDSYMEDNEVTIKNLIEIIWDELSEYI